MSSDCLDDYHAAPPSPLLALVGMPHLHGALQAAAAAAEPKPRVLSFASDGAYVEAQPVPSGEAANLVLKPGWLHKHTHCIAGAAALLASWDDSTSATGVAAQIGAIRNASGRSRLLLVLVQASGEASPAPPSEERIAALRRACDLEPRNLLVVSADGPPPSLDAASLARGVKVLLEAAAAYYRDEARRARPPKATAPQLAARHHTKRAVFAELSHEPVLAQRHWQLAAEQLRELVRLAAGSGAEADVASSVPLHEVKRVAELAVRRICAYGMTAPQGAAAASRHTEVFDVFRRHVRLFQPLAQQPPPVDARGAAAAGHVHSGWMGKQHRWFAKLLEESDAPAVAAAAAGGGSAAEGSAHFAEPGFYYQAAASCALQRRRFAEVLSGLDAAAAGAAAAEAAPSYGAVAAVLGVPAEVNAELDTRAVIELLTRAYERFKRARAPRMIYFLAAQMADEYLHSRRFDMARRFYGKICRAYQRERWWRALAHIQRSLRRCALELRDVSEYLQACVALLSREVSSAPEAEAVLGELLALVRVSEPALPPPPPSPFLPLSSPALLELLPGQALLSCTAEWALPRVSLGEEASLTLRLASSLAVPLSPSSLRLAASGADLSGDLSAAVAKLAAQSAAPHGGEAAPRLCIPAGGELLLELSHSAGAVGTVAPKQLELVLGETPCAIVLILPLSAPPPRNGAAAPPPEAAPALLQVTPPPPAVQLTFQGAQPVLVGEVAPLCVSLDARSDGIADGTLSLSAAGPTSAPPQAATGTSPGPAPRAEAAEKEAAEAEALEPELLDEGGAAPLAHPLSLPPVVRDECHRVRLLLRAVRPGAVRLQALLEYAPAGGGAPAETVVSAMVEAVPAVEVRCEYLFSPTRTARGSLARDEPLHLLVTASCLAPLAAGLVLHSLEVRPSLVRGQPALEAVSAGGLGARCDALLREGSEHTALFALRPCADLPAQSLGTVVASWSRAPLEPGAEPSTDGGAEGSGTEPAAALAPERSARLASPAAAALPLPPREALPFAPPASSTEAALPAVAVEPVEFDLALTVPSEGRLGALLQLQLSITNRTDALHTFRLSFSENEAFLFSGFKLQQFQLPPGFGHTAKFNLVPILSGPAQLPPLRLLCTSTNAELLDPKARRLVFVAPGGVQRNA